MLARNITSSAATKAGFGLAVARAVGRNAAALRHAAARLDGVGVVEPGSPGVPSGDLRTLAAAGIVDLDLAGRRIKGWRLTANGRALAARL